MRLIALVFLALTFVGVHALPQSMSLHHESNRADLAESFSVEVEPVQTAEHLMNTELVHCCSEEKKSSIYCAADCVVGTHEVEVKFLLVLPDYEFRYIAARFSSRAVKLLRPPIFA